MKLLDSKKGGLARNYVVIPLFLLILGVSSIFGLYLWLQFVDAFTVAGVFTGTAATVGNSFTNAIRIMDGIVVLMMVAMIIALGITSYRIKVPSIYFIAMLILGIFLGVVSYFFNYIFIQIVSQPVFDATRLYFAKTILICTNLHWVSLVAIIVGSILTYSKKVSFDEGVSPI